MLVSVTVRQVVPTYCRALISLSRWISTRFTVGAYFREPYLRTSLLFHNPNILTTNNTADSSLLLSKSHRWSSLVCCELIICLTPLACLIHYTAQGELAFTFLLSPSANISALLQTELLLSF